MIKLTCPVCDRSDIDSYCCPNCETDLSILRMMMELPETRSNTRWIMLTAIIGGIVLGLSILVVRAFF